MTPKLLPLTSLPRHGSRSRATCLYRCGNACSQPVPNQSNNPHVHDLVEGAIARRSMLRSGALGAGALVVAGLAAASPAAAERRWPASVAAAPPRPVANLGCTAFTPVAPNVTDAVTNAKGFRHLTS